MNCIIIIEMLNITIRKWSQQLLFILKFKKINVLKNKKKIHNLKKEMQKNL